MYHTAPGRPAFRGIWITPGVRAWPRSSSRVFTRCGGSRRRADLVLRSGET